MTANPAPLRGEVCLGELTAAQLDDIANGIAICVGAP